MLLLFKMFRFKDNCKDYKCDIFGKSYGLLKKTNERKEIPQEYGVEYCMFTQLVNKLCRNSASDKHPAIHHA